jgi:cytochrome c peroxidase
MDSGLRALCLGLVVLFIASACQGNGNNTTSVESTTISVQARVELAKLSPSPTLAAPSPDLSNQVADDPNAAALGHKLFFDTGFSGVLLESDNDGTHGGVGLQGQTGKVSCASCHIPASGFVDTRSVHKQLSLAAGWSNRRAPSILDVGHASLLMWDGRFDSLQRQALAVYESAIEGNSSRLFLAQEIARRYATPYQGIFGTDPTVVLGPSYPQTTAVGTGCKLTLTTSTTPNDSCQNVSGTTVTETGVERGIPGAADYDALTSEQQRIVTTIALNATKAIAAFERLLSCGASRFDAFMHGDKTAMSESEQRGAALFVGKAKCASCHSGQFFSDQQFHNVGMYPVAVSGAFLRNNDRGAEKGLLQVIADPLNVAGRFSDGNDGRLPSSVPSGMLGAFRTPMLRCVSTRPSFMHTGQFTTLEEVVDFFNRGGDKQPGVDAPTIIGYLGETELAPLGLSTQETGDLVAFLKALDGPGPAANLLQAP